jgi:hypothetical protein
MPWVEKDEGKGVENDPEKVEKAPLEPTEKHPDGIPIVSPDPVISCLNEAPLAYMEKGSKAVNPAWIKGLRRKLTPLAKTESGGERGIRTPTSLDGNVGCKASKEGSLVVSPLDSYKTFSDENEQAFLASIAPQMPYPHK